MDPRIMQAKAFVERGYDRVSKTFAAVPDDKINWSPSPTSKSPLSIVVHIAESNSFLAMAIKGEPLPKREGDEDGAKSAGSDITTREQADSLLAKSRASLIAGYDALNPADLEKEVTLPFTTMPMGFLMFLPAIHAMSHAAQIDYIQTIYGDTDFRM